MIYYNQNSTYSTPEVDSIAISGSPLNTITFTGTGFLTSPLLLTTEVSEGRFRGAVATEVSRTDTEIVVKFADGMP